MPAARRTRGRSWLTEAELAGLSARDTVESTSDGRPLYPVDQAGIRLLVRAFGTVPQRRITLEHIPCELLAEPVLDEARQVVATAGRLVTEPKALGPDRVHDCFAGLWGCAPDEVQAAAWDRGIADPLWPTAEPFARYCRVFGRPEFTGRPNTPDRHEPR